MTLIHFFFGLTGFRNSLDTGSLARAYILLYIYAIIYEWKGFGILQKQVAGGI
jgi:hypothetical protein